MDTASTAVVIAVRTNLQITGFRGSRRSLEEAIAVNIKDLTRIASLPDAASRDLSIASRNL